MYTHTHTYIYIYVCGVGGCDYVHALEQGVSSFTHRRYFYLLMAKNILLYFH